MNLFENKDSIKSTDAGSYILEEKNKFKLKNGELPKTMFINTEFFNMLDIHLCMLTADDRIFGIKIFKDDNILEHDIVMS